MKHWICLTAAFLFLAVLPLKAQELNCNVTINASQIEGTSTQIFESLKNAVIDFISNKKWTEMNFASNERIECSINIIIKSYEISEDKFDAEITVQSRRPVYGSNYNSTVLNIRDTEVNFNYKESDRIEYYDNMFTSGLSSLLAYYAYLIIGYDADTYSRLGGTTYFQKAENIALAAQSSDYKGWQAYQGSALRYTLVNNLMDEAFKKLRNYYYDYHRLGLDMMSENSTNGRERIAEGLPLVREANRARPSAIIVTTFMDSKSDELVNIFSEGSTEQRQAVYDVLNDIAPTRKLQFEPIIKNK